MNKTKWAQCHLERRTKTGRTETASWLPIRHAKVGNYVKLKESNGEWTDGWAVKLVGPSVQEPPDWRKAIRNHRHRTGDDRPKERKAE